MNKLWLIAKSNMKRRKGNMITLFLLVIIGVVLMYSSLNVLMNVQDFVINKNEKQNGAHVSMMATPNYKDEIVDICEDIEHFESIEVENKLQTTTICDITNVTKDDGKKDTMMMIFDNMEQEKKIGNWTIVDQAEKKESNSIILPMYLKVAKGYRTGDQIQVKINHFTYQFKVYGFIEDVVFASPTNITMYSCETTEDMYNKMIEDQSGREMFLYNIRLDSMDYASEYEGNMSKGVTSKMTYPDFATYFQVNISSMIGGTTMMINIIMAILAMFSVVMIIIVVLVIRFNMMMYLEENLPNIGIMEAQGYTTKQVRNAMLLEYVTVCMAGVVAGLAASGLASTLLGGLVSGSVGLAWIPEVDIRIAVGVAEFVLLFVAMIVLRTATKLRKITTLDALRGGIQTYNFKKNHMPLEKGRMGLDTRLGLKSLLHNTKQNIAVVVIVSLLSFACVLSLLIYYNFAGDDTSLLTLVGLEKCDIEVASSDKNQEELDILLKELVNKPEIEKGVLYGWQAVTVSSDTDELSLTADVYDDFNKLVIHPVFEGREAERDNEVVVTSVVAERFHLEVGDSVQLKAGNQSKSYIVCGISQQISNMGVRARMTKAGAGRLNETFGFSGIDLYVQGETPAVKNVKSVVDQLKDEYRGDLDLRISNVNESFESVMGTFSDSLILMCAVFVIITVVVVVMIILMIMRMKMVHERKAVGVYKAIGYTTKQIVWQMVMAFAPIVTLGGVIGGVLGAVSLNQVFVLALSFCKIQNAVLSISPEIIISCVVLVMALAFAVSALVSAKARRIEPVKMIVEE